MAVRYPGIEGYRNAGHKIGKMLSGAFQAVGSVMAANEMSKANKGMLGKTSDTSADYAGELMQPDGSSANLRPTQTSKGVNYPMPPEPGFWTRLMNPQFASHQYDQIFQSQMKQAENQEYYNRLNAQTQQEKDIHQFDANLNSFLVKAQRDYGWSPEQAKQFGDDIRAEQLNKVRQARAESMVRAESAQANPEAIDENYLASLAKQGVENRYVGAQTAGLNTQNLMHQAELPYASDFAQLKLNTGLSENALRNAQIRESDTMLPGRKQLLENQAKQAGVFNLGPGTTHLFPPGYLDNLTSLAAIAPQRAQPSQSYMDDENHLVTIAAQPAQAGAIYNMGGVPNVGQATTLQRPQIQPPLTEGYQYYYDANGKPIARRKK